MGRATIQNLIARVQIHKGNLKFFIRLRRRE